MIIEIIVAILLGIGIGVITGLLPGIHINLVAAIVISSLASLLLHFSPLAIIVFITSMSIAHTFLDFIPSVFLGAPDESALSVLPGHKFLLEGRGYEASRYALTGCLLGVPLLILLTPVFLFIIPKIFFYLKFVMLLILISVSVYMLVNNKNKLTSVVIFALAGFLGIITLLIPLNQPLLPLLSGLFGSSSLILSIRKKEKLKPQQITKPEINSKDIKSTLFASLAASPLCAFLPALGSSQAAIIGSTFHDEDKENSGKRFLMLLGNVNILVLALSFITLYSIDKARTGAAAAISDISSSFTIQTLGIIIAVIILSSFAAFFIAIKTAKIFSSSITKINYQKLSLAILAILSLSVILFSGIIGFAIYFASTFTGIFAIESGERRTNLMGCLMLPSILLYL